VTIVSLAPASPPARMLVSVEVFCFLVMVVMDDQKFCGVRRKGATLMNIHIYTNLAISIICWDGPGCQPTLGSCPLVALNRLHITTSVAGTDYGDGMWGVDASTLLLKHPPSPCAKVCNACSCQRCTVVPRTRRCPLKVVISLALCGLLYFLEMTVHFYS